MRYQLPWKTPPVFLAKPPLNLLTVCNPLFRQSLLYIGFLWTPLKTIFFGGPQKYYIFSSLKVHWHISKKQYFEKYCFCGKTCQYSPLLGTPWQSLKTWQLWQIYKQTSLVFYTSNMCLKLVEKEKLLGHHNLRYL